MITHNKVEKSGNVIIRLNGEDLAGQQNAVIIQTRETINITNRITPEWVESLPGTRSWRISCGGLYVVNATTLEALEDAFMKTTDLEVEIQIGQKKYQGSAILTSFPVSATFSKGLAYKVELLGTGELKEV